MGDRAFCVSSLRLGTSPALADSALLFVLRVIHAGFCQFSLKSIHFFSMFRRWRHTLKRPRVPPHCFCGRSFLLVQLLSCFTVHVVHSPTTRQRLSRRRFPLFFRLASPCFRGPPWKPLKARSAIRFDQGVSCRARALQPVPSRATLLAFLPALCPRKQGGDQ